MSFWDFFTGSQTKMKPYNKGSLRSLENILQTGGGLQQNPTYQGGNNFLQQLLSGGPEAYKQFEAPLMQNFEQNIAPGIAERYAGLGTGGGASSSSALQNSLAQAGRNLQTDIGALRGNLQMQALPQALNYAQSPLMMALQAAGLIPGQHFEIPGQQGLLHHLAYGAGQGLTRAAMGGIGG